MTRALSSRRKIHPPSFGACSPSGVGVGSVQSGRSGAMSHNRLGLRPGRAVPTAPLLRLVAFAAFATFHNRKPTSGSTTSVNQQMCGCPSPTPGRCPPQPRQTSTHSTQFARAVVVVKKKFIADTSKSRSRGGNPHPNRRPRGRPVAGTRPVRRARGFSACARAVPPFPRSEGPGTREAGGAGDEG